MELLTYSSKLDSQLNEARRDYWSACYMLGEANRDPRYDKALWLRAIPQKRRELAAVAKRYRARLKDKKVYRVPMVGEASTHYMYIPAFSAVNAQYRVSEIAKGFTIGDPVCLG